jgi:2-C-methyl-D-erythritol 4-phosphate cytidylyltransferase
VLVLSDEGRDEFERISGQVEISKVRSIVNGGKTRAKSVKNGLDAVDAATANVIAVHDGARPLVTVDEIIRTVEKAAEMGAACLVAEVTDTIKEIDGEYILNTIDRRSLRRALTPQAFRYDILRKAFEGVDLAESVTDECSLVERLGVKIAFVAGNARNIKITRPEDLILAEAFLKSK